MKPQEVITVVAKIPAQSSQESDHLIKTYEEIEPYFNKGMYIESFNQIHISEQTYIITFILRYYNQVK